MHVPTVDRTSEVLVWRRFSMMRMFQMFRLFFIFYFYTWSLLSVITASRAMPNREKSSSIKAINHEHNCAHHFIITI